MLKIQFKDKRREPIWVLEKLYTIGSATSNNLVLSDAGICPLHARLVEEDQRLLVKDNNSLSGCFVNGQRVTQKELLPGDLLRLGEVELEILDPRESQSQAVITDEQLAAQTKWSLVADSSWLAGQEFQILQSPSTLGRGSDCDITVPGTHLSRRHVELTTQGNTLHVRDLGSANGTFINDKRVTEGVMRHGDRLRLDVYSFRTIGPEKDIDKTRVRPALEELDQVVERRSVETEPKRWITRPTSPGNRIEEEVDAGNGLLSVLSGILCLVILGVIGYLLAS